MSKKNTIIATRVVCACHIKRFIAEDVEKGKVPCKCGELNVIEDYKAVKHYPNKLSQSYQDSLNNAIIKKGSKERPK